MDNDISVQEAIDILAYEADELRGLARDYTRDAMRLYDRKYRAHIMATAALRRISQAAKTELVKAAPAGAESENSNG